MRLIKLISFLAAGALAVLAAVARDTGPPARSPSIAPATMPRIGTVDERFESYNIEMVEVTGGSFWKPYASANKAIVDKPTSDHPTGVAPSAFEYRPPINLSNSRLRKLAAALGPAYVRVSGTWANTTFFQNTDAPPPATPPPGFKGVLTRAQWKGVVDFARAVNAELVTSVAIGSGTRNSSGAWTPDNAREVFDYTHSLGGHIAAAEYFNEPNMATIGGAPQSYTAAAYGQDVNAFRAFAKQAEPSIILLGPGSVAEGSLLAPSAMRNLMTSDLLAATGPIFDAFSYHSYAAVSSRCARLGAASGTAQNAALSSEWLARPGHIEDFYAGLRDRFEPGKPLWLTETAQAACGGDRWASTFLDTFRYLNQLGLLAQRGVQVHMHNTLAASDYGLLDEKTYQPRPNYWAALLWRNLMGTTVLDPRVTPPPNVYAYAHCLRNQLGGVALLVINASESEPQSFEVPTASERFTLTAGGLTAKEVQLNGRNLQLGREDAIPQLHGVPVHSGMITFAPASVTFLSLRDARNPSCRQP